MKYIDYPKFKAVSGKEIIGIKKLLEDGEISYYEALAMIGKVVVLCSEEMNLMTCWLTKTGGTLAENEAERIKNEDERNKALAEMRETIDMLNKLYQQLKNKVASIIAGTHVPDTKSVFKQVYCKSHSKPSRPQGGSYQFEGNLFSAPQGWKDNTASLSGDGDVWMSYCTFMSDGTNTGWSDPARMIEYDKLFDKIDEEMNAIYKQLLSDAERDLNAIMDNAKKNLENARQTLEEAKNKLKETKDFLDSLDKSIGESGITKDDIAKIALFSNWYDKNAGSVTMLATELDAVKGTILSHGEHIDTLNQTISNVRNELNAVDSKITNEAKRIDALNNTIGEVRTEWNAKKASIESSAKWIDTNKNQVNQALEYINGLDARIDLIATAANTAKNEASAAKLAVDGLNSSIELTVEKKIGDAISAGKFEITPEKIVAAIANSQGAGAAIVAALNGDTSEIKISADRIALNGEVIARLLQAQRIVINNGASVFEPDGSGYIAGGNIRWDKDGNISTPKGELSISNTGSLSLKINRPISAGSLSADEQLIYNAAKNGDIFVSADGKKYSTNKGATWQETNLENAVKSNPDANLEITIGKVVAYDGKFYAVTSYISTSEQLSASGYIIVYASDNGTTWTAVGEKYGPCRGIFERRVYFLKGRFGILSAGTSMIDSGNYSLITCAVNGTDWKATVTGSFTDRSVGLTDDSFVLYQDLATGSMDNLTITRKIFETSDFNTITSKNVGNDVRYNVIKKNGIYYSIKTVHPDNGYSQAYIIKSTDGVNWSNASALISNFSPGLSGPVGFYLFSVGDYIFCYITQMESRNEYYIACAKNGNKWRRLSGNVPEYYNVERDLFGHLGYYNDKYYIDGIVINTEDIDVLEKLSESYS